MNAAPALLGYAAAVGLLGPHVMLRSKWPHRAPALAVAVWSALAASFSLCLALGAFHLATPSAHLHGIFYTCRVALGIDPPGSSAARYGGIAAAGTVVAALLTTLTVCVQRARAARGRHREVLDLVGRPSATLRVTVLEHAAPAAYCLPGRHPRVVVSRGAVELLSGKELGAVVEHERAHIAGRHHLMLAASQAFAIVFRGLPLARGLREQIPLLLEMVADDRALRRYEHTVLATAMYEMASATVPDGALAAGGHTVLVRLQRILSPTPAAHPALRSCIIAAAVVMQLLPLLVACPPGLGLDEGLASAFV
ncbi:M56 family metallopeptidase [Streptomyces sp. NBC_00841]|uniref:M56 family metallopeptidase n=1 Tax=unclassified Streptomyces TaxID=2593676 RepID=UPI002250F6AA|nr:MULTISPECIES: M56 family metallopeptidase [unclassified Streptomyces]MCX4537439.1 M56 family metallopeptidase [Streptomyces sp. NBC_01669]WRZ97339.1 M56 family metallopeptidase [Streptomyces sp. NBC_00841]